MKRRKLYRIHTKQQVLVSIILNVFCYGTPHKTVGHHPNITQKTPVYSYVRMRWGGRGVIDMVPPRGGGGGGGGGGMGGARI